MTILSINVQFQARHLQKIQFPHQNLIKIFGKYFKKKIRRMKSFFSHNFFKVQCIKNFSLENTNVQNICLTLNKVITGTGTLLAWLHVKIQLVTAKFVEDWDENNAIL